MHENLEITSLGKTQAWFQVDAVFLMFSNEYFFVGFRYFNNGMHPIMGHANFAARLRKFKRMRFASYYSIAAQAAMFCGFKRCKGKGLPRRQEL
jgi:hypothetical protein